jgi:hypothetical protein
MIHIHEFTGLRDAIRQIKDWNIRTKAEKELENLAGKFYYYKDVALHGRDSDDAFRCRQCSNNEEDFILLDLAYPDL